MKIKYIGEEKERVLWGRAFPQGELVELSDTLELDVRLAQKALSLEGFEEVGADEPPKPKRGRPPKPKPSDDLGAASNADEA